VRFVVIVLGVVVSDAMDDGRDAMDDGLKK
jgi:hypothetical protein